MILLSIFPNKNPRDIKNEKNKKNKIMESAFERKIRKKLLFNLDPNKLSIFIKNQSTIFLNNPPFTE